MLEIGTTRRGRKVTLTDKERSRHVHVIGSTGTGKSKLLEHLIRQDIARGRGLCLIDPHGTLADKIEQWCAQRGMGRLRKVHLIRPGDDVSVPGFNPLRMVPGEALSVRVDAMVAACAQAWGVRDLSETPRLEKILRSLFYVLAVRGLTLAEGPALLRGGDPDGVRRNLTENLPDPIFNIIWGELNGMPRREFTEHVESAITRLSKFLAAPSMKLVVGQRDHAIDFRAAMDAGEIVIVNLGARNAFSYENARVLGTLLINDLFLTALGRTEEMGRKRPFTLYVDEAYDFLSGDVERILDQTRKFGLHAVLAHQRLGQLKERGEGIYSAVMNISNKIVLGGLSDDDAGILAREIMRGDIDLTTTKPGLTMPVVVDEVPFWLESESETETSSEGRLVARSYSTTESIGLSVGTSATLAGLVGEDPSQESNGTNSAETTATSTTTGVSFGESFGTSRGRTVGRSQTLRSVREERRTQFYSLEERMHLAQLRLRNLPDQAAIVKRRGQRTVQIETIEVKPMLKMLGVAKRFRASNASASPYISPVATAEAEIAMRSSKLHGGREPPGDDAQFWTEE